MHMSKESLLARLMSDCLAGWLAGQIVHGTQVRAPWRSPHWNLRRFHWELLLPQLGSILGMGIVAAIIKTTLGALSYC